MKNNSVLSIRRRSIRRRSFSPFSFLLVNPEHGNTHGTWQTS